MRRERDRGRGQDREQAADSPPALRTITDARTLRALSHPVRVLLIEELFFGGPLTATEVGERIGETPTTCSFHLRQLARYGFVEEAGGGKGRARPWKLAHIGISISPDGDPAVQLASDVVTSLLRNRSFARYQAWRTARATYSKEWQDAANDTQTISYLTVGEFSQMTHELADFIMRWTHYDNRATDPSRRPPDAIPIETLAFSYPIAPPPASNSTPLTAQPASLLEPGNPPPHSGSSITPAEPLKRDCT